MCRGRRETLRHHTEYHNKLRWNQLGNPRNLTEAATPNRVNGGPLIVHMDEGYLQKSHRTSQETEMKSTREPNDFNGSRNATSCEGRPPCA